MLEIIDTKIKNDYLYLKICLQQARMPVAKKTISKERKTSKAHKEEPAARIQPTRAAKAIENKVKRFKPGTKPTSKPVRIIHTKKSSSDSNYVSDDEDDLDYGDISNRFYQTYFIQKDDDLTHKFKSIIETDRYVDILPPSFIDGLPNLDEREPVPLKTIPLYSKLIAGIYQNNFSQYDKTNVRVNINFFTNNLPSFKKYAKKDPIDWVVTQHRLLVIEIFDYYKNKKRSLSTIENRLNAILRVIRIAYGTKLLPLYKLFSELVFQINDAKMYKEGDNCLNEHEERKYINWEDVLYVQKDLEEKFNALADKTTVKAYNLNNDLLLISLYSLIPPLRNEVKMLEFTTQYKHNKKDYIYYNSNSIVLKFNKVKKRHGKVHFDLTSGKLKNLHLANIIKQSIELYPRKYVFTPKNSYPDVSAKATMRALDERLINIFFKYGIVNQISVNSLRSSYVSYRLSDINISYNDKKLVVYQMRTSMLCLERSYRKIIKKAPVLQKKVKQIKSEPHSDESCDEADAGPAIQSQEPQEQQEPQEDQYSKKKQRDREYYQRNKERLNEYQREYNKSKKTPFERTRDRLCQLLNASEEYHKKMKQATKDKYKFIYDETAKRWKWDE
jgi:hypothetical protein